MPEEVTAESRDDLLRTMFDQVSGETYLTNPSPELLESLSTLDAGELPETLHVVATDESLKEVRSNFLPSSYLAEHVEAGIVSLYVADPTVRTAGVVSDDALFGVVDETGGPFAALPASDSEIVQTFADTCSDSFGVRDEFSLRTPALSRALAGIEEQVGEEVRSDFETVLGHMDVVGDDTVTEVELLLLLTARNEGLLYDISKAGEDVGISSKATFSRSKTNLEDLGFIGTDKVPIDVGRPRLRLLLEDDELATVDIEEFGAVAQERLADR
ncbi:DUF5821 family protein [Halobaculum sp. MBLA0147]|uniref:transcriptional regulator TbsP domain-containing protein n=1 Tax=Halobaculum sp. MBLA0147 TaxID=3079934 RepID=UPI0035249A9E